jgi:alkylated DNA repair dioxygenase AlkB
MASQNTTQYPTSPSHTTRRPLLGDDGTADSAGSLILYNLLPQDLAESVCDELNTQLNWQKMYHQTGEVPRLVCCQATFGDDGSVPVYRHPSDHTLPVFPWTATVDKIRQAAEEVVGHPLNHALIQLYRDGNDFITEHSDKTLDVAFGSSIVNVSFGAQRTMRLRTKRGSVSADAGSSARVTHRVPMPHNSMIVMSLPTNAQYLHGIHWDKRRDAELSDAEKAFGRQRISLTFRQIATFSNPDSTRIWGQGATGKTPDTARPVLVGDASESDRMIRAFGKENAASSIVWHDIYGRGFDVLHL